MPTIMTPTITTRRRKHSLSQQYTGTSFLTVDIHIEYGPYSERLGDIRYGFVLHSANPNGRNSFRTGRGRPHPYSVRGPICDRNLKNFIKLGSFVIYGISSSKFAIWLPCEMLRRKQQYGYMFRK
jgi:hypothetical protein